MLHVLLHAAALPIAPITPARHTRIHLPSSHARRYRWDWGDDYYRIKQVVRHRVTKRGPKGEQREYLVKWDGVDPKTKQPWQDSWQPAENLTADVLSQYESRRGLGVPSLLVQVDVAVVLKMLRRSLAHALMFGAPKASGFQGRNRPRCHSMHVGLCQLEPIALGVLELARKHGGPAIKLKSGNDGTKDAWWQLEFTELERIAKFCDFESFLESGKAVDNIRLTGTAKHSGDMLAVGQPFMITVKRCAHTPEVVDTNIEFVTVHFNGKTGQPTYPPMSKGTLKKPAEREKLIKHVRDRLPELHPLRVKGWCALPNAVSALAIEVAVPDKPQPTKAKPKGKVK